MDNLRPAILDAVASHLPGEFSREKLIYLGRKSDVIQPHAKPSKYDEKVRHRLLAWLEKNGHDRNCLIINKGVVRLGDKVPKSIDTMLMKHWSSAPILQYLELERDRRLALSAAAKIEYPVPKRRSESSLASAGLLQNVGSLSDVGSLETSPSSSNSTSSFNLRAPRRLGETIKPKARISDDYRSSGQIQNGVAADRPRAESANNLATSLETHVRRAEWHEGERKRTGVGKKRAAKLDCPVESARADAADYRDGAPSFPHFTGTASTGSEPKEVDEYLRFESADGPRYAKSEDQSPAFLDRGNRIDLTALDDDAIVAALKLAAVKFDYKIAIQGSEEFRERAFEVAQPKGLGGLLIDADFVARRAEIERARHASSVSSSVFLHYEAATQFSDRHALETRSVDNQGPSPLPSPKGRTVPDYRADPERKKLIEGFVERLENEVHLPLKPQRSEDREAHTVPSFSLDLVRYDKGDPSLPFLIDVSRFDDDPAIQECFLRNHRNSVELAEKLLCTEAARDRELVRRREFDHVGKLEPKLGLALLLARDTEAITKMLDRLEREWMRLDRAETKRLDAEKAKRLEGQGAGKLASEVRGRSFSVGPLTDTDRSPSFQNTDPPELIAAKGPRTAEDPPPTRKDDLQR